MFRRPKSRLAPKSAITVAVLVTGIMLSTAAAPAQGPMNKRDLPEIDGETRAAIIDSVTAALNEAYVFPDKAVEMETRLRAHLADGRYDKIRSVGEFAHRLTEDLRDVCKDRHLGVEANPPEPGHHPEDEDEQMQAEREEYLSMLRRNNFGFRKIEHLAGNVGYLKLDGFNPAEFGGATAIAAMNYLAHSSALIIDLRQNGGGSPSMIQLISSYLLDERTHLNSFYIRKGDSTKQFWTQEHVEGPKMVDTPLFVLTSNYTFSAAEEFTYNLQNLERATIVGETTGGGAHPVDRYAFAFDGFSISMSLPFGRAVNPITNTNWEGTGVEPDIAVAADEALETAHLVALEGILKGEEDEGAIFSIEWAIAGLRARSEPVDLTAEELGQYVGEYGPRKIRMEEGGLQYQREDRPAMAIIPMGNDYFMIEEIDFFRIKFERNQKGEVIRLNGMYDNGRTDSSDRS